MSTLKFLNNSTVELKHFGFTGYENQNENECHLVMDWTNIIMAPLYIYDEAMGTTLMHIYECCFFL